MEALIAQYNSDTGDTYLQAFYFIRSITITYDTKTANIEVDIFSSQANFDKFQPLASNNYQANGSQFTQYFSESGLKGTTPLQAATQFLQTIPSISNPTPVSVQTQAIQAKSLV